MSQSNLPTTVDFGGQSITIVDHAGHPWLAARDLARALGYADTSAVTRIHATHASEFTGAMTSTVKTTVDRGAHSSTCVDVRIFSPRGCHLVAMFARTKRAADFRRWVLDVLEGLATPPPAVASTEPKGLAMSAEARELLRGYLHAIEVRFCGKSSPERELERLRDVVAKMQGDMRTARLAMTRTEQHAKVLLARTPATPADGRAAVGTVVAAEDRSPKPATTAGSDQAAFRDAVDTINRVLGDSPMA
ncbi:MAG: hypothetical protein L0H70_10515 [Xanthomonadales bacterium]|nr:hypothetical protein [Xanthomonadales bacterium]